ncbi:Holliday junction resolvase RuvX [Candidatus Peregrinibacteria bacterium]|nr:Holliday junction resolvase RuvX [Candidatus Peregrinibacteria bacterium]
MSKGRYLAIDYGDKRIGLAISDVDKQIAFPRENMAYEKPADAIAKIAEFCAREGIVKVILGLPVQMDGTVGERFVKTHAFGGKLKEAIDPIPVEFLDERLTSKRASQLLQEQGVRAKHHKGVKDMVSAQVILDAYLRSIQ